MTNHHLPTLPRARCQPSRKVERRFTSTYGSRRKAKPKKRTPLGREIARLATGRGNWEAELAELLGRDLLVSLVRAHDYALHETACRVPLVPRKPVQWKHTTQHAHADRNAACGLRTFLACFLKIVERVNLDTMITCGRKTWLGRATRGDGEYVPKGQQLGMARDLDSTTRTLQRFLAVMDARDLVKSHQPQKKGGLAPDNLPDWMRGKKYAYNVYRIVAKLPRQLIERLRAFYKKHGAPPAAAPADLEPRRTVTPQVVVDDDGSGDHAALALQVLQKLKARPA